MNHWFDRLAKDFAGAEKGVSRRKVLKGAGVAAFAASPLASPLAAQAAAALEGRAAQAPQTPDCNRCLNFNINAHNARMRSCDKNGTLWSPPPAKGKKKKARPVSAAKRLACAMQERSEFGSDLNACRIGPCKGQPIKSLEQDPNSPFKPQQGNSSCPGGTTQCPDNSCCFGGDLCCVCPNVGGYICCVAVVGCTCCCAQVTPRAVSPQRSGSPNTSTRRARVASSWARWIGAIWICAVSAIV